MENLTLSEIQSDNFLNEEEALPQNQPQNQILDRETLRRFLGLDPNQRVINLENATFTTEDLIPLISSKPSTDSESEESIERPIEEKKAIKELKKNPNESVRFLIKPVVTNQTQNPSAGSSKSSSSSNSSSSNSRSNRFKNFPKLAVPQFQIKKFPEIKVPNVFPVSARQNN